LANSIFATAPKSMSTAALKIEAMTGAARYHASPSIKLDHSSRSGACALAPVMFAMCFFTLLFLVGRVFEPDQRTQRSHLIFVMQLSLSSLSSLSLSEFLFTLSGDMFASTVFSLRFRAVGGRPRTFLMEVVHRSEAGRKKGKQSNNNNDNNNNNNKKKKKEKKKGRILLVSIFYCNQAQNLGFIENYLVRSL
jgi:hypothetical protein